MAVILLTQGQVALDGKDRKIMVDHINHDTLNNRKENLRITDTRGNASNLKNKHQCASKHVGVSWHKAANKWEADAALAYQHALNDHLAKAVAPWAKTPTPSAT